jgi:hypothetical protein
MSDTGSSQSGYWGSEQHMKDTLTVRAGRNLSDDSRKLFKATKSVPASTCYQKCQFQRYAAMSS